MALSSNGTQFLSNIPNRTPYTPVHRPSTRTLLFTVSANPKKLSSNSLSSRTGKFDSKNRKTIPVATEDEEEEENEDWAGAEATTVDESQMVSNDGTPMPKLPGEEQDFWEGSQWDGVGFFVQYMWAFGVVFAVISSGIAVATYNEGATDFKETPAYKESLQSRDLLEVPDTPNADVFESNPTEQAPSLD